MQKNYLDEAAKLVASVRKAKPLVHQITNYVTVNDCANITLAVGGSPIMADEPAEVEEIVSISQALVINMGNLNKNTIEAMVLAGKKANEVGVPVIFDPVGAGASTLRTETAKRLIKEVKFAALRGNISEMKTLNQGGGSTRGVDAAESDAISQDNLQEATKVANSLANSTGSVVAITGPIDLISNGKECCYIKNGHPMMASVTGTGCMCSALVGAFCGSTEDHFAGTIAGVMAMGLAGERAYEQCQAAGLGNSSYRNLLIDEIFLMTGETLLKGGKISCE